jgi:hypothetical protein
MKLLNRSQYLAYENAILRTQYYDTLTKLCSLEQKYEALENTLEQNRKEWITLLLKYDIPPQVFPKLSLAKDENN